MQNEGSAFVYVDKIVVTLVDKIPGKIIDFCVRDILKCSGKNNSAASELLMAENDLDPLSPKLTDVDDLFTMGEEQWCDDYGYISQGSFVPGFITNTSRPEMRDGLDPYGTERGGGCIMR